MSKVTEVMNGLRAEYAKVPVVSELMWLSSGMSCDLS